MIPLPRLSAIAAAVACCLSLAACGGGSDGSSTDPGTGAGALSQDEATADASNGQQTAAGSASAFDDIFDTTEALAATPATASAAGRAHALGAAAATTTSLDCAGGGTATLAVDGGTAESRLNGRLDAGERYTVTFAGCSGRLGLARLDGSVEVEVVSVSADAAPVTTATLAMSGLTVSSALGAMTLGGSAQLERSTTTDGAATTTNSHLTAQSLALTTSFNARNGHFTLSDADWTRIRTASAGVTTGTQFAGRHTLSGNAGGFSFSQTVATTGSITYDAAGNPVGGQWTSVRPGSTIATTVAAGIVTLTLDIGSNGSIERTWTFPLAQLDAAAG